MHSSTLRAPLQTISMPKPLQLIDFFFNAHGPMFVLHVSIKCAPMQPHPPCPMTTPINRPSTPRLGVVGKNVFWHLIAQPPPSPVGGCRNLVGGPGWEVLWILIISKEIEMYREGGCHSWHRLLPNSSALSQQKSCVAVSTFKGLAKLYA